MYIYKKFTNFLGETPMILNSKSKLTEDAQNLFDNITGKKNEKLKYFSVISPSKRATMIDLCVFKVEELLNQGFKPSDISVITPVIDDMLKFCLREKVKNANSRFCARSFIKLFANVNVV